MSDPHPRRGLRRALGGFVLLLALLFPGLIFGGRVLYERDISIVWQPQVDAFVRAVGEGSWPLWDPRVSFGHPMLANANTQVLYPFNWLNLVLRPGTFYTLHVLVHLFIAGAGLYLLARRLGLSAPSAFLAGGAYLASGPLLSLVSVWHHLAGAALLPWVCLAAESALSSGRTRDGVVWGLVLGFQVLAGSPDMTVLTGLTIAAWTLWHLASRSGRGWHRVALSAALALVLALGVSAAQWLPALDAAAGSARASLDAARRVSSSTHPLGLLELLSPSPWTDLPIGDGVRRLLYDGAHPFLHAPYLGAPVLGLAALAFAGPRRPRRALLAALAIAFVLVALGRHTPVYDTVLSAVPILRSMRYPSKALVPAAFAVALLAGMGLETWREAARSRRGLRALAAALLVLAVVGLASTTQLTSPRPLLSPLLLDERTLGASWAEALRPFAARWALAAVLWLAFAAAALWQWRRPTIRLSALALALALVDLWSANRHVNPTAPGDLFGYRPPLADLIRAGDASRVFVYRYQLKPAPPHPALSTDNPYRIAWYPDGYDVHAGQMLAARLYPMPPVGAAFGFFGSYDRDLLGLYPRPLAQLVEAMAVSEGTPAYARYLRVGGVGHVLALHSGGLEGLEPVTELPTPYVLPIRVYRVPQPLPRTYVVGAARPVDGPEALRTLVDPGFDPFREVLLPPGAPTLAGGGSPGNSRILDLRADRVRLEARLERQAYVVLLDTYDPGWKVSVDGRPAPLLRANVAFRAVVVEAGQHVVELVYRPRSVIVGLWVSASALACALGALSLRWRASSARPAEPG